SLRTCLTTFPCAHGSPCGSPPWPVATAGCHGSLWLATPANPTISRPAARARSLRLSVRTSDFQSEKTGSTPVGSAMILLGFLHHLSLIPKARLSAIPKNTLLAFYSPRLGRHISAALPRCREPLAFRPLDVEAQCLRCLVHRRRHPLLLRHA